MTIFMLQHLILHEFRVFPWRMSFSRLQFELLVIPDRFFGLNRVIRAGWQGFGVNRHTAKHLFDSALQL